MQGQINLKPQDILVLLKLHVTSSNVRPKLIDLAVELGMSASEVSQAIKRANFAGLCDVNGKAYPLALKEFVLHGLKYVYPDQLGYMAVGMPTSHSAAPLKAVIKSSEAYVWPDVNGKVRGQSLQPLYPSVPFASKKDPQLYELLALVDALRIGNARERKIAVAELSKRLS
jgi:hypothetical protein